MLVTFNFLDGALGFATGAPSGHAVLGVSATGTLLELTSLTDGQQAVTTFTSGPLVENSAFSLANGRGVIYAMRVNASTAGVASAVAPVLQGNSDGVLALTNSTPLDAFNCIVLITRAGKVAAAPTPAFKISFDLGITYSDEIAVPIGGVYTGFIAKKGIRLVFSNGAVGFVEGDRFTFTTTAPTWNNNDLSAALAALRADARSWEFFHVLGVADSAVATVVQTAINQMARDGRYVWAVLEPRDINVGAAETEDAWMASITTDFATTVSQYGQMVAVAGFANITSAVSGDVYRRSLAWPVAARAALVPLQEHLGRTKSGPLAGITQSSVDKKSVYHDERVKPGLETARFLTVQSRIGKAGFYVGGTTKRSCGTLAETSSDYNQLMRVRVILYAAALCLQFGTDLLGEQIVVNPDGTITEQQANEVDADMTARLRALMVPKYCVSIAARVNRLEKILVTRNVTIKVLVRPYAYAEDVTFNAGFENPNLVVAQAA